jgi:RNA polymerase sigma-70 factor (ECF subfamily)
MSVESKQELLFLSSEVKNGNILPEKSQFGDKIPNNHQDFWQLWNSHQSYIYNCCLKWLNGNYHDAEDTVNQVMLKAWSQWTQSTNDIEHPKSWLAQITYNCCIDVSRKRQLEVTTIDNIDDTILIPNLQLPESQLLNVELKAYLKYKIASLPDRLRYPFILRCCQNKSYPDIAKQLTISEENVRKRIQEARKILKRDLNKYLAGEDNTSFDSFSSLKIVIPIVEEIDYKATLICLEALPHHWYNSPIHLV